MIWVIVVIAVVVGPVLLRFWSDLNKDKIDLVKGIDNKFKYVVQEINTAAFRGKGNIHFNDRREFNLYKEPSNQIIFFQYGAGILTIIWKYKYFQKEVVHERSFHETRNLSVFEQQNIAYQMIYEMSSIIERHQVSVLGQVDSEDELLFRLNRMIKNKAE